jgi:YVTN family beta-propeller protein
MQFTAVVLALILCVCSFAGDAAAVEVRISYADPPGEGFLDPDIGAQRRAALEAATGEWGAILAGTVPVTVEVTMVPLGGSGNAALLASTGPTTLHRNFGNAQPNTWYAAALANQLSGRDLNGPDVPEIVMIFNGDLDNSTVLGSIGWYYGMDAQPGVHIDFVTIALHELAHGLGFFDGVDPASGEWSQTNPTIFDRFLLWSRVGGFADLLAPERRVAIVSNAVVWNGPAANALNRSPPSIFAPDPYQPGSSLGHWDTRFVPSELLEPFYSGATRDVGLVLPALIDMGWTSAEATSPPRTAVATPTPTDVPAPAPPSIGPQPAAHDGRVYVANYDDGTVSAFDPDSRGATNTIRVGNGPLVVAASPDGTRVYVGNFQDGTVSVIDTRYERVVGTFAVGDSVTGLAVTPDAAQLVLTDTVRDEVVIAAAADGQILARVSAGPNPAALALDGQRGLAFAANFSGQAVTVVDVAARLKRATIDFAPQEGLVGIAVAADSHVGLVTAVYSGTVVDLDTDGFSSGQLTYPGGGLPQGGVALRRDGGEAYVVTSFTDGAGSLTLIRDHEIAKVLSVGSAPQALALSPDETRVCVANSGSDSVSIVDVGGRRVIDSIPVGRAPMGIAIVDVPRICGGDCNADGAVAIGELVRAVGIALGDPLATGCDAADANGDGAVDVSELVRAVASGLDGCS